MKKIILFTAIAGLIFAAFFIACDSSGGSGDDVNDAKSLGSSLVLSGTVDRTFVTSGTPPWTEDYSLPVGGSNFRLYDESTDPPDGLYETDTSIDENVNFNYTADANLFANLYSSSGWTGVSSSNPSANITTAVIDIDGTSDDIVYGNFESAPVEWYYYLYSTAETILNGTYVDTDDDPDTNHFFDNVRVFEGWNRMRKITSDRETFTYTGGDISEGHWTHMDNLRE